MILSNLAIRARTAVFVFIVVLVLAGVRAYKSLPREGAPDITIPFVFVSAFYEGTAPEDIEKLIAIPLEKKLNDVENVKEMRSTSAENLCSVSIEFLAGTDIDQARRRVKDKVDLAAPDLPDDLDEPIVDAFNFSSDFPVMILALSGDADAPRLKNLAEDLQDRIEQVPGVKEVTLAGIREREVRVEIDLPRLIAYRLPLSTVLGRIARENRTVSAGNVEVNGSKFQVRVPGEFDRVGDLREVLLAERDGRPIYLTDVAEIADTFKDEESITRLDGDPCVSLQIMKRSGVNAVALIDRVQETLDAFALPPDIRMTVVMDESDYVDRMVKELENNIVSGFLLVLVALFMFLGLRNSFFVATAIPLSMLIAFAALRMMGQSLNMIVLFSLVLAVGMLVDNAIVIVENIYRNRTLGLSRIEAARRGAGEVAWPVITSTLTTVAAFYPLLAWPDIMGQFMGYLPRTLIVVLFASLFVALVINPAVCSVFINARPRDRHEHRHPFVRGYERILRATLDHRVPVLLIGFALLVFSAVAYGRYGLGVELFPDVDPRNAKVDVRFPQGASLERTDEAIRAIERQVIGMEDVKFVLGTAGAGSGGAMTGGGAGGTHQGNVHIEFVEAEERQGNTTEHIETIRERIGRIAGAEVKVDKEEPGPPTGAPVMIEVSGDDFDLLAEYAGSIQRSVSAVPGLVDLRDDLEETLPEIQFRVDRRRAALLGFDPDGIGQFLRMAVYGLEASTYRAGEDEYDITVRLPKDQRDSLTLPERIRLVAPSGETVPLSSLGEVVYTGGRGAIARKDRKRVVTISGNNQERGVDKILADVQTAVAGLPMPRGYDVRYAGDTEEMNESGAFLSQAFAVAVGLILVILVIQFNSALLPLIIIVSVVLSLIGVMWGLLICRMRFGVIMTGLGVISLAGVVVNNAIVLIDCILQRRAEGLPTRDAVVEAGILRLRPVLLTAVTTILGLIPMAVGYSLEIHHWPPRIVAGSESSAWWAPMAVAVIFGLAVATVLTLVLIPVMYSLIAGGADAVRRRLRWGED